MVSSAQWTPQEGVAHMTSLLGQGHAHCRGNAVVAAPGDVEQIAAVLRFAQEHGVAAMPVGGGTKLGWGNPVAAAIELSLERLNRLQEHAWQDMTCRVEAGLPWHAMQAELARHGQMVALDPLWPEQATVGGIVASNDSGALRLRYGGLRDLILGMTVVLADGTIARSGGKVVKNVAGYDLHKLMTGSLGTLAVIAEVNFRVHPVERSVRTWTASAPATRADAAAFSAPLRALRNSSLTPLSVQLRASNRSCALDIRIAGTAARLDEYALRVRELLGEVAQSDDDVWMARQRLWEKDDSVLVKISVLPDEVCSASAELQHADAAVVAQATGIVTAALPQVDAVSSIERLRARVARSRGSVAVLRLPQALREHMDIWGPGPSSLPLMQEIKRRFDPSRALNPGRLWEDI